MRTFARSHKEAISKEAKRIDDKRKEEQRIQREKEEAKRLRREARAAARERKRIIDLKNRIITELINPSQLSDIFKADTHRVFDVRDPHHREGGIFIIGGLVGELLITFTCLNDYILANPSNQNFNFSSDIFRKFLRDLLVNMNFPDGALTLHVQDKADEHSNNHSKMAQNMDHIQLMKHLLTQQYIDDFGL